MKIYFNWFYSVCFWIVDIKAMPHTYIYFVLVYISQDIINHCTFHSLYCLGSLQLLIVNQQTIHSTQ